MPLALALALAAAVLAASAAPVAAQPAEEGLNLPERMDRALRDMIEDLQPALEEMMRTLEPALDDMGDYMRRFEALGDPGHYEMPEILPNGDIIIRRREDAPPYDPEAPGREPATDPEEGIRI